MHSTVQTGLYTPNIFNCDHNYHHPNSFNTYRHNLPNHQHHHFQIHQPHHHNHQRNNNKNSSNNKLNSHGSSSANVSMLAINLIDGSTNDFLKQTDFHKRSKLNLSSSNIAKLPPFVFSSNRNLNAQDKITIDTYRKTSICSSSSGPAQISVPMNTSPNISGSLIVENNYVSLNDKLQVKTSDSTNRFNKKKRLNSFWDCSKPCGLLTTILGVALVLIGLIGLLLLFESNLCNLAQTCSNALLKVCSVCGLVIGIVLIFLGLVIVVYTKKDGNTKVIITSAKNFDKIFNSKNQNHQDSKNNNYLNVNKRNISLSINQLSKLTSSNETKIDNFKGQKLNSSVPLLNTIKNDVYDDNNYGTRKNLELND